MPKAKATLVSYFIVLLGALFYGYEYFLRIIPAVIKPQLMGFFHIDATLFGTLSAFYFYAYTPLQLIVGIVVDHYRPRYVLLMAVFLCASGSLLIAHTHSYQIAAAGRFLQGFGSAFAFVGALKLVTLYMPANRFAFYSGLAQCLGFIAAGAGLLIVETLAQHMGWQMTIKMFSLLGLIVLVGFGISLGKRFKPPFQAHDKSDISLKDNCYYLWRILHIPQIWLAGLIASLTFLPTSVFAALWGVPYMQKLHGFSLHQASFAVAMIFFGWAAGTPLIGWLSDKFQTRGKIIRIACILAFFLSLPLLYWAQMPYAMVCILFFLFGLCSACEMLCFVIARDISPNIVAAGTAIALINTFAMLGGAVFQRGLGELLDFSYEHTALHPIIHGIRVYPLASYEWAVSVIPIALALASVLTWFNVESYGQANVTPYIKPKPTLASWAL